MTAVWLALLTSADNGSVVGVITSADDGSVVGMTHLYK